ncbi:Fatty acid desaturase 4, chloroplastic [Salvia divinorum]|uniref:Fatty acid desaturase 4, chloroplastic n=1 Tax=Salvia divinorum TaxID=28513 RepID=A0ABD1HHU6_SALDI
MAILPQRHPSRILNQIAPPTRIHTSTTAPPRPRRPHSSPLTLDPAATPRPPLPNDPTLRSNWSHRAWLASGCTTVLISLSKSVDAAAASHTYLEPILAALLGYVLADLASGVYHWGIDNYGGAETPVFGAQIDAFQGHHRWPWTITRRQFANNLHALARAVAFTVTPINLACGDATALAFVAACSGCIMFSQQSHAWAHTTRSKLPPLVAALQDGGVLVSRSQHAAHHRAPYNNNYCIVSGAWNEVLDASKFFEIMEMVIFFKFGVRPRSWTEPNTGWVEEAEAEATSLLS